MVQVNEMVVVSSNVGCGLGGKEEARLKSELMLSEGDWEEDGW